uniref:DUF6570 domain-containing protein n=1 Tax=Clytia hemisphaerica TaxID=252671 RepID=A0A7M5XMZ9_9CNID
MSHTFLKCDICMEIHSQFYTSFENKDNRLVNLNDIKLNKKNICPKCVTDSKKRKPKKTASNENQDVKYTKKNKSNNKENQELRAAKWSIIRHNNMHFGPIPECFKNLTTVELALISKITVCMRVHMLRYGMMSSKGHSISIPQRMSIATQLPNLPEQVGIVVLKRRSQKQQKVRHFTVQRQAVEIASKCLCFGIPNGGYNTIKVNTKKYGGTGHKNRTLTNKYFEHFPLLF